MKIHMRVKLHGKLAVLSLVVFTVLATAFSHNYFVDNTQYYAFMKNVAIVSWFKYFFINHMIVLISIDPLKIQ